jgi:hypothetical protein
MVLFFIGDAAAVATAAFVTILNATTSITFQCTTRFYSALPL